MRWWTIHGGGRVRDKVNAAKQRALSFTPSLAAAADLSFMADEQAFAIAYTAEHGGDGPYHIVVISNLGPKPIEIRVGKGR